jgi:photosystem II stability/assembly factor-like uncharacterized protein
MHFSFQTTMRSLPSVLLFLLLSLPICEVSGQTWTWSWVRKIGLGGFNDSFCVNPLDGDIIYASPGNSTLVISRDRGHTWNQFASLPGGNQVKAIAVSARDTSVFLVAQEASPDRIMKSTNNGATWFQTLAGSFYYWGHPLAYEPLHNDETVYTEASNIFYRSGDFGSTWDTIAVNPFGSNNQGWEDAFIRPDSSNTIMVSDNANGIWKTTTKGQTWRRVYTASGEVPAIAVNLQNPAVMYATKWGGGGGFLKSTNYGETWTPITLFNGKNMWGVAISTANPDHVFTATWGHSYSSDGGIYFSRDAGATWERTYSGLGSTSNHSLFSLDTLCFLALQGDGIWKLRFPGLVSGNVYADLNGNGIRDSLETGKAGYPVYLTGARLDSTLSDGEGKYTFTTLAPGTYSVTPPSPFPSVITEPLSGSYSLTVSDGDQFENRFFGLAERTLQLLTPIGGENWALADTQIIRWNSLFGGTSVSISLSRDSGTTFTSLLPSTTNDGEEPWIVTGPPTNGASIRITSDTYPLLTDTSDSLFTIHLATSAPGGDWIPTEFVLHQNYPNPFNPSTTIRLDVPYTTDVHFELYSVLGQMVKRSHHPSLPAGVHTITIEAGNLSSGIYLYRVRTATGFTDTRKMTLVR